MRTLIAAAALASVAGLASAGPLEVTEIYRGVSGPDGTADWFEVVNVGSGFIDTGDFRYDDSSAELADAVQLESFILSPGEVAVFMLDASITDFGDFTAIWGSIDNLGNALGGSGLGNGGDAVTLFNANGDIIESASYGSEPLFIPNPTYEFNLNGSYRASVLGEFGAYESAAFFNDEPGFGADNGNSLSLIGSPGIAPAPGSVALLALGAVAARRRR